MVAPEDDDGVVRQSLLLERVQHEADLGVHIADGGIVAVTEASREGVADLALIGDVGVALEFAVGVTDEARGPGRKFLVGGHVDLGRIIEVPVFLGRHEREVRLGHADGQEEGFSGLLELTQGLGREAGGLAVGVSVVRDIGFLDRRPARAAFVVDVRRVALQLERGLRDVLRRLGGLPGHRPARGVVVTAMEDLAHALAVIAVVLEILRDGHGVRQGGAEMRLEIPDPGGVRTTAGHQRGARRAAHGLLAVSPVEGRPARADAIQIRGLDDVVPRGIDLGP